MTTMPRIARLSSRAAVSLVLAAGLPSALASGQVWKELGPAPIANRSYAGRVSAVACSPSDPDRYFIGGADGGVWRTTDGGRTWKPLTDRMPTTSIGALLIDPSNENVIYAGTGEGNYANHSRYGLGLFKSTDGGDTWVRLAESVFAGRAFAKLAINPQNTQILYAAITRAGGFPELAAAKGHPAAQGPLGVFRSTDGGVSWTNLTNGLPNLSTTDITINPANPNVLYAGVGRIFGSTDNGIYKTTDGGDSWVKLAGGLPTGVIGRISVGVASTMPARVFTMITRPSNPVGGGATTLGAWRSDDAGASWTPVNVGSIQATYGWYLSVVAVKPTNPDLVVMGGLSLRRSQNAGASWSSITPPHVDMHAVAWDASGRLVVGDDGGVHRSNTDGGGWISLNNGLGTIQFYSGLATHPTDPLIIFGGTQDNGSNRRNTDTRNWDQVFGGDGGWTQLDQADPLRVFVEFQGTGNLYRSIDGGGRFRSSRSGISSGDRNCFLPPYLIDPLNSNRMVYATHRIYHSQDGGASWSAVSADLTKGSGAIRALAQGLDDPKVIYAATNDGNVQVSFNRGTDWERILSDNPGWPRVTREMFVDPRDANVMYLAGAVFGKPHVRRTTDAGQTWETLDGDLPDMPFNVLAVDVRGARPVLYAGADAGLYRSVFGGDRWHRYGRGLPNVPVIDIRLNEDHRRIVIGTQGRGAWSIPIAVPGDMNGDGSLDLVDIEPLITALTDPDEYANQYPDLDAAVQGDLNGDGSLDLIDIEPFIELLLGP